MIEETYNTAVEYLDNTTDLENDYQNTASVSINEDILPELTYFLEREFNFSSSKHSVLIDSTYASISELCDLEIRNNFSTYLTELDYAKAPFTTRRENGKGVGNTITNDEENNRKINRIAYIEDSQKNCDSLDKNDSHCYENVISNILNHKGSETECKCSVKDNLNLQNFETLSDITKYDERKEQYLLTNNNDGQQHEFSEYSDKALTPEVYRKRAFTDLFEKLLKQIELNDSFICFQKMMNGQKDAGYYRDRGELQKECRTSFRELVLANLKKDKELNLLGTQGNGNDYSRRYQFKQKCSSEITKTKPNLKRNKIFRSERENDKYSFITLINYTSTGSKYSEGLPDKRKPTKYMGIFGKQQKKSKTTASDNRSKPKIGIKIASKNSKRSGLRWSSKEFDILDNLTMKDLQPIKSEYPDYRNDNFNRMNFLSKILKISNQQTWKSLLQPIPEEETKVTRQSNYSNILNRELSVLSIPTVISRCNNHYLPNSEKKSFRKRPPSPHLVKCKNMKRSKLFFRRNQTPNENVFKTKSIPTLNINKNSKCFVDGSMIGISSNNTNLKIKRNISLNKRTDSTRSFAVKPINLTSVGKESSSLKILKKSHVHHEDVLLKAVSSKNMSLKTKSINSLNSYKAVSKNSVNNSIRTISNDHLQNLNTEFVQSSKTKRTNDVNTIRKNIIPKSGLSDPLQHLEKCSLNVLSTKHIPTKLTKILKPRQSSANCFGTCKSKTKNSNNINLTRRFSKENINSNTGNSINSKVKYEYGNKENLKSYVRKLCSQKSRKRIGKKLANLTGNNKILGTQSMPTHILPNIVVNKPNLLSKYNLKKRMEKSINSIETKIANFLTTPHNEKENSRFFSSLKKDISTLFLMTQQNRTRQYPRELRKLESSRLTTPKRLEDMRDELDNITEELFSKLENILAYIGV